LTDLTKVQQAVSSIPEQDQLTTAAVLGNNAAEYNTSPPGMLSNVVGFIATIESLQPQVTDIRAATAYVTLQRLGLAGPVSAGCELDLVGSSIFVCHQRSE
jgi:hypothetical protein